MNLNGKFWNFWPNFIHLKSFSVVCFLRIQFSFPYAFLLYKSTGITFESICAWCSCLFTSLLFTHFFSAFRETLGITKQVIKKENICRSNLIVCKCAIVWENFQSFVFGVCELFLSSLLLRKKRNKENIKRYINFKQMIKKLHEVKKFPSCKASKR